ncbi:MAG: hypothetical protein K6C30_05045 [Bacteroidaceae bacterium]|nr:hypothetical protein [Bacteroidaceae bacterium]
MSKQMNSNIQFSGTPKEQAHQLLELLKDKHLDIDALKTLLPANVEVIREFITCMKEDMAANAASYNRVIGILESSLKNLEDIIKDGEVSEEEKKRCHEEIVRIHQHVCDIQLAHEKNLLDFWAHISKYVFLLLAVIVVIASGGKVKLPKK